MISLGEDTLDDYLHDTDENLNLNVDRSIHIQEVAPGVKQFVAGYYTKDQLYIKETDGMEEACIYVNSIISGFGELNKDWFIMGEDIGGNAGLTDTATERTYPLFNTDEVFYVRKKGIEIEKQGEKWLNVKLKDAPFNVETRENSSGHSYGITNIVCSTYTVTIPDISFFIADTNSGTTYNDERTTYSYLREAFSQ